MLTQRFTLFADDNGYYGNKVKCGERIGNFRSKVLITNEEPMNGNSIIEYQGVRYKVGEGVDDLDLNKTRRAVHKICTLYALGHYAEDDATHYRLVVGLPLNHYKNKDTREEYRSYLMESPISIIKVDGKLKSIYIDDCIVFGQGAAALFAGNPGQWKGKLIGVLDFGGLTINGAIFEDLKMLPESLFTINAGMLILNNRVKTAINQKLAYNCQDYEIPYLMAQPQGDKMKKVIEEAIEEHFEEITKELRKKNWSLDTLPTLGIGGGILATKHVIQRFIPKLMPSDNPIYANVMGLYNVGRMVWNV